MVMVVVMMMVTTTMTMTMLLMMMMTTMRFHVAGSLPCPCFCPHPCTLRPAECAHGPHGPRKMPPHDTSVPVRVVASSFATSTSPLLTLTLPVSTGKVKTSPGLMLQVFVAMGMRTE